VRGVLAPEEAPQFHTIRVRRYRCAHCQATCTVVPVDVRPFKHFGAVTIALALTLYGALQRSLHTVHATLNPTRIRGDSARGWDSVLRWIAIVSELFPAVRESPADWSSRQVAARAAGTLAATVRDESLAIPSRVALAVCHGP
jgi:hypothetical protein